MALPDKTILDRQFYSFSTLQARREWPDVVKASPKLSFAAFKILSLSLTSGSLIVMCLGMGLFGLSC